MQAVSSKGVFAPLGSALTEKDRLNIAAGKPDRKFLDYPERAAVGFTARSFRNIPTETNTRRISGLRNSVCR